MVFFVHLECGMQGVVVCYVMMDTSDVPPITARERLGDGLRMARQRQGTDLTAVR